MTHFFDIPCLGTLVVQHRSVSVPFYREKFRGEYFLWVGHWHVIWTPAGWRAPEPTP